MGTINRAFIYLGDLLAKRKLVPASLAQAVRRAKQQMDAAAKARQENRKRENRFQQALTDGTVEAALDLAHTAPCQYQPMGLGLDRGPTGHKIVREWVSPEGAGGLKVVHQEIRPNKKEGPRITLEVWRQDELVLHGALDTPNDPRGMKGYLITNNGQWPRLLAEAAKQKPRTAHAPSSRLKTPSRKFGSLDCV